MKGCTSPRVPATMMQIASFGTGGRCCRAASALGRSASASSAATSATCGHWPPSMPCPRLHEFAAVDCHDFKLRPRFATVGRQWHTPHCSNIGVLYHRATLLVGEH